MNKVDEKLLELLKLHQTLVEQIYEDVKSLINSNTVKMNGESVIKSIPRLKMNLNMSRQRIIVQIKANIRAYEKQLNENS